MSKIEAPLTVTELRELAAEYRHVKFPGANVDPRTLRAIKSLIIHNCRVTRRVIEPRIIQIRKDCRVLKIKPKSHIYETLCTLRREALALEKSPSPENWRRVEKLKRDYDNFIRLVTLMFLLSEDPELARGVSAAL